MPSVPSISALGGELICYWVFYKTSASTLSGCSVYVCVKGQRGWAGSQLILTASLSDVLGLFIHYSGTSLCPTSLSAEILLTEKKCICVGKNASCMALICIYYRISEGWIQWMMHNAVFIAQVESLGRSDCVDWSFWLSLTYQLFSHQFIYSFACLSELYVIGNSSVIIYRNRKEARSKS